MDFIIGKKVQHAYTKEYLWVLRVGNEQILCRTKDLREIWFYPYELEEINTTNNIRENMGKSRFL